MSVTSELSTIQNNFLNIFSACTNLISMGDFRSKFTSVDKVFLFIYPFRRTSRLLIDPFRLAVNEPIKLGRKTLVLPRKTWNDGVCSTATSTDGELTILDMVVVRKNTCKIYQGYVCAYDPEEFSVLIKSFTCHESEKDLSSQIYYQMSGLRTTAFPLT